MGSPQTRLIAIADLHLDSANDRNADRLAAWDQCIDEGSSQPDLGAWLVAGDVFHTRSTPQDRNDVTDRVIRMAMYAPVLIIPGNHESPRDMRIYGEMRSTHPIRVVETPQCVTLRTPTGASARVFCLPYATKAGLAAAGVAPGEIQDAAAAALDAVFIMAADELAAAQRNGLLPVHIGHGTIVNAMSSAGQPMGQHGEIVIRPDHLGRLGSIPKIYGHIHKAQDIYGATYTGSSCRMDFGETEPKRYVEILFHACEDPDQLTWELISKPLHCPPRYHVAGQLARDTFTWQATKGPGGPLDEPPASWRGCEVRVRYTFLQSDRSVLREALILAEFAEASRLQIEAVAIADREVRSPEVAAARTLSQKVAAYLQAPALTDSLAAKLSALETLEPSALLLQVQNELADMVSRGVTAQ